MGFLLGVIIQLVVIVFYIVMMGTKTLPVVSVDGALVSHVLLLK